MISKQLRVVWAAALLSSLSLSGWLNASPAMEPSTAALAHLEKLRGRKMGVDRAGNLWSWGAGLGLVTLVSPAGLELGPWKAGSALTIDVDAAWGTVGIFQQGYEVQWLKEDGEPKVALRLDGPASDVCWIGPGLIAVSPQTADHRIEIWDLQEKTRVKVFGDEIPIHPAPGANRLRSVLLRYDFQKDFLYSLESFTGDLKVFDQAGKEVWRATVENPRRAESEKWLREIDQKAKSQNDVQIPTIFNLRLALSPQGEAWVLQSLNETDQTVTLVQVSPNSSRSRSVPAGACPSYDFFIWGSHFFSFRGPDSSRGACTGAIPLS